MSIEDLLEEHRRVAAVARRWGDEALHLWYADLGVEVDGDNVSYWCPGCGTAAASSVQEFVYHETNESLMCTTCRGDVDERSAPLD